MISETPQHSIVPWSVGGVTRPCLETAEFRTKDRSWEQPETMYQRVFHGRWITKRRQAESKARYQTRGRPGQPRLLQHRLPQSAGRRLPDSTRRA